MHRDGGFTMIELMMVVAVLGILTVVAVVGYSRIFKKARSGEIPEIFGELKAREEAYHAETGAYLGLCDQPLGTDCAEGDNKYWPNPLPGGGKAMDATALPVRFQNLHVNIGRGSLYCQYEAIAGLAGDNTAMGTHGTQVFGATAPVRNWYYLLGQCDWDADNTINAQYWQRDDLEIIGSQNEMR